MDITATNAPPTVESVQGVSALILAGGQSRRMGQDKAMLFLERRSFLQRIAGELEGFDELLVSVNRKERYQDLGYRTVPDLMPDAGALGGIYSGLCVCRSHWLLVAPCDLPLFERGLAQFLVSYLSSDYDAVVLRDRQGQLHPLCGLYARGAAPLLLAQLGSGNYRMADALASLRVKVVSLRHCAYPDRVLTNINTRKDYDELLHQNARAKVVAVSGVKNSGKTTLLENLLPRLCAMGLSVAVIKHDGHDFTPDVPGTDSDRLRKAGAKAVAVYSSTRYLVTEQRGDVSLEELIRRVQAYDLILLEGAKHSLYPKLEVVRRDVSSVPVCATQTLLGVCTDASLALDGVAVFGLNDYDAAALRISRYLQTGE